VALRKVYPANDIEVRQRERAGCCSAGTSSPGVAIKTAPPARRIAPPAFLIPENVCFSVRFRWWHSSDTKSRGLCRKNHYKKHEFALVKMAHLRNSDLGAYLAWTK
jgi:hypothetical protein